MLSNYRSKAQGLDDLSLAIDVVSEPQLEEISVFYPSHTIVSPLSKLKKSSESA